MRKKICGIIAVCISACGFAQAPNTKFGKIDAADLQKKIYSLDSNAAAVVLFDIGRTEIIGNNDGWFSYVFKQRRRVHILNKSGYDIADIQVPLYKNGSISEELSSLKAVTYNLEGGKVTQTKLEKSGVFEEQLDKNHLRKKFTLPNVKEGSIIEYEYTVTSPYLFGLQPWAFQSSVPHLWSEFEFSLLQFMDYVFMSQGYHLFLRKKQKITPAFSTYGKKVRIFVPKARGLLVTLPTTSGS